MTTSSKPRRSKYKIVKRERNRVTKTMVEVIDNRDGKYERGGPGWATLCADHGKSAGYETRTAAMAGSRDPSGWCPACKRGGRS